MNLWRHSLSNTLWINLKHFKIYILTSVAAKLSKKCILKSVKLSQNSIFNYSNPLRYQSIKLISRLFLNLGQLPELEFKRSFHEQLHHLCPRVLGTETNSFVPLDFSLFTNEGNEERILLKPIIHPF